MFVFNIKLRQSKKLIFALGTVSIAVSLICVVSMYFMHENFSDTATCDQIGQYSLKADNAQEQARFLKQFKIETDIKSRTIKNITIPKVFNDVYKKYNDIQKQTGLDLEGYKGKTVEQITFPICNKANKDSKYNSAVILVYKSRVIGAHITNGEYGCKYMPLNNYGQNR